ncbi:hypothetical protein FisN_4Lu564 [Fistulifera solaris]|uniref:Ubiquitin-activating enzyme SCCH domain-containing protein n=1 Tax=Fistulifera solaris TaxID=1519565 RepID=A0A1Z5JZI4_FISSO|nr:hypothetical protein FisN_4Lu564 [Fistulifera solaris]|eukprot:GAX19248.1 hypothetical protein FisN_4Lu564 [Fistulifera solaris]
MFISEDATSILSVVYQQNRNEADNMVESDTSAEERMRTALDHARSLLSNKKEMSTIDFEKNYEANGHVACVNAASD